MDRQKPFFSIIIPTYNRPQKLKCCLESLSKLDYPQQNFELVIVDDGSKMSLESIINSFKNQLNINLLKIDNSGPANARNRGAELATGKYLTFTDDDCCPASNWLTKLAEVFAQNPNCLVGGRTINSLEQNIYSTASQELTEYLYNYYHQINPKQASFFASNNFALSKQKFMELGGFDTSFPLAAAEDREFCDRWKHSGYSMIYSPEINVYHAHDLNFVSFLRQHFNYGRGAFHFHQVRDFRQAEKIDVEPLSFYFNLFAYPFSEAIKQPKGLISILLFLSQVSSTVGFLWEKIY